MAAEGLDVDDPPEAFDRRLANGGPFETAPEDNLETLPILEGAYAAGDAIR